MLQAGLSRPPSSNFSTYLALEWALAQMWDRFQQAASKLSTLGVLCIARSSDSAVNVRVERQSMLACGLRISFGSIREDRLVMTFVWPGAAGERADGWATAERDPEARQPRLRYVDVASGGPGSIVTADGLLALLWAKIIDHLALGR